MTATQKDLLENGLRIDELRASYAKDSALNEPFIVQTIGSSAIATLGLIADNPAVVIGAMVVAPWILPLRTVVFAILAAEWRLVRRALATLLIGAAICLSLSLVLGQIADYRGLLIPGTFQSEIVGRLSPSVLDLCIAVVAGAVATYAKVRPDAVSAMAGTAIAVALVPPVCAAGLTAASADWGNAFGASLLFAANLLGIVMGGIAVLVCRERFLRRRLVRSRRGQAALVTAVVMSIGILMPLSEGSKRQRSLLQARQMQEQTEQIKSQIEGLIAEFLMRKTLTFQTNLAGVSLDLNGNDRTRVIDVSVYASDPTTPSFEQVEQVQTLINEKIGQPLRVSFQLRVQRIPITVVSGSEQRQQLRIVEQQAAVDERLKLLEKQLTLLTRTDADGLSDPTTDEGDRSSTEN